MEAGGVCGCEYNYKLDDCGCPCWLCTMVVVVAAIRIQLLLAVFMVVNRARRLKSSAINSEKVE